MMKSSAALTFALLLFVVGPGVAIAQDNEFAEATTESPIETTFLAFDDELMFVYPSHVRDYAEWFDRAAATCLEDRETVGGLAGAAHRIVRADGARYDEYGLGGRRTVPTRDVLRAFDETFEDRYEVEISRYLPTCAAVVAGSVESSRFVN